MFECMEIAESIYEGFVEPSYKNYTRADANCDDLTRKTRGESTSSTIYYEMSESNAKHRKRDVDHPKDRSKLTFIIHGPGN